MRKVHQKVPFTQWILTNTNGTTWTKKATKKPLTIAGCGFSVRQWTLTECKMVPKARIELARPWVTAPSRQRVYQFHHFGTQLYVLLSYSLAFGASGAGAASSDAAVGIGITFSAVDLAFSSTLTVCGILDITDPVLDVDEK